MDDKAYIWALEPTQSVPLQTIEVHQDSVVAVSWCPSKPTVLATAGMDGIVKLIENNEVIVTLEGGSAEITCMEWHCKHPVLIVACADGSIWCWEVNLEKRTANCMRIFTSNGQVTCLCWSTDNQSLLTGSYLGAINIWPLKSKGEPIHYPSLPREQECYITCIAAHPNGQIAVVGTSNGTLHVFQVHSKAILGSLLVSEKPVECLAFSQPNNNNLILLATGSLDGSVSVWDAQSLLAHTTPRFKLKSSDPFSAAVESDLGGITCLEWVHNTFQLVTASTNGIVMRWDALKGNCLNKWLCGRAAPVHTLSVSPVAPMVVVGGEDGVASVFEFADEQ